MKCPHCNGNNFAWATRCDHCGRALTQGLRPRPASSRDAEILTSGTPIALHPATTAQIDLFRLCWPFGLHDDAGAGNAGYGLICRRPDREMMLVKFQQVDVPLAMAKLVRFQNRVLIAMALRAYLERGHRGVLMPCAYLRPKGPDLAETGIAYVVGPHPDEKPQEPAEFENRWDGAIGIGATTMIAHFAHEVARVIDKAPRGTSAGASVVGPLFLTMELRPVSSVGVLDSRIAVVGPDVLVTMPNPGSIFDSAWDFVARAGFSSLPHAPMTPVELRADGSLQPL